MSTGTDTDGRRSPRAITRILRQTAGMTRH